MADKRKCFINNPTSENIRITELNLSLPPGISNLFDLNAALTYEQIDYCLNRGTLRASIDNGMCYVVPDPSNQHSFSDDVLIRMPLQVQAHPSRARFTCVQNTDSTVFDAHDSKLFADEDVKPAREIEEEIKKDTDNTETIEATIKAANLDDKPIGARYVIPPPKNTFDESQKMKNDIKMGWRTCNGKTDTGKRCLRRAKKNSQYCGLHEDQAY